MNSREILEAFANKDLEIFKEKIQKMDSFDLDARHSELDYRTLLQDAALQGSRDFVEALLRRGADPNYRDFKQNTSLHHACTNGDMDTIRLLTEEGADSSLRNFAGEDAAMILNRKRVAGTPEAFNGEKNRDDNLEDAIETIRSNSSATDDDIVSDNGREGLKENQEEAGRCDAMDNDNGWVKIEEAGSDGMERDSLEDSQNEEEVVQVVGNIKKEGTQGNGIILKENELTGYKEDSARLEIKEEDKVNATEVESKEDKVDATEVESKENQVDATEVESNEDKVDATEVESKENQVDATEVESKEDKVDATEVESKENQVDATEVESKENQVDATEVESKENQVDATEVDSQDTEVESIEVDYQDNDVELTEVDSQDNEVESTEVDSHDNEVESTEVDSQDNEVESTEVDSQDNEVESTEVDSQDNEVESTEVDSQDNEVESTEVDSQDNEIEFTTCELGSQSADNDSTEVLIHSNEAKLNDKETNFISPENCGSKDEADYEAENTPKSSEQTGNEQTDERGLTARKILQEKSENMPDENNDKSLSKELEAGDCKPDEMDQMIKRTNSKTKETGFESGQERDEFKVDSDKSAEPGTSKKEYTSNVVDDEDCDLSRGMENCTRETEENPLDSLKLNVHKCRLLKDVEMEKIENEEDGLGGNIDAEGNDGKMKEKDPTLQEVLVKVALIADTENEVVKAMSEMNLKNNKLQEDITAVLDKVTLFQTPEETKKENDIEKVITRINIQQEAVSEILNKVNKLDHVESILDNCMKELKKRELQGSRKRDQDIQKRETKMREASDLMKEMAERDAALKKWESEIRDKDIALKEMEGALIRSQENLEAREVAGLEDILRGVCPYVTLRHVVMLVLVFMTLSVLETLWGAQLPSSVLLMILLAAVTAADNPRLSCRVVASCYGVLRRELGESVKSYKRLRGRTAPCLAHLQRMSVESVRRGLESLDTVGGRIWEANMQSLAHRFTAVKAYVKEKTLRGNK